MSFIEVNDDLLIHVSFLPGGFLEILDQVRSALYGLKPETFIPGKTFIPASKASWEKEDYEAILQVLVTGNFTCGSLTHKFERELGTKFFSAMKRPIFVNSGSSANLLAVSALMSPALKKIREPLKPGDEVITVACGFPTTTFPVLQNGLVPVFVDVNLSSLNTDLERIQQAWSLKTKAVILAHTLGIPYDAHIISKWCQEKNLFLIEDCCDALGSRIENEGVGNFGDISTLSFYPAHHLSTAEGGAVMCKSEELRKIVLSLRDWGRDCYCEPGKDNTCGKRFNQEFEGLPKGYDHKFTYTHLGYNLKGTEFQGALGLSQIKRVDSFIEKRKQHYKNIASFIHQSILLNEFFVMPVSLHDASWFGIPLRCRKQGYKTKICEQLEKRRIGTRPLFAGNLIHQPCMKDQDYRVIGSLENTDHLMEDCFWIACHPLLEWKRLDYMKEQLELAVESCL